MLSHSFRTILANPGYTLAEIPLLFSDKAFRDKLVKNVQNPETMQFWGWFRRLEATPRPSDQWQLIESTLTRLSQFLANDWLYRVLYQAKGTIKFHELVDSGKTIIFSLPIGKLGEEPASLLGSLLLGKLATTIFSRNEYGKEYPRVHLYIDEYARFSIPMISQLWTQARKFNCGMTATIQSLSQIKDEENRAAILQAGNLIAFQCIGSDADIISRQMPLPDPVSLMKPEPILLYSQTPVEDIWHKGHQNPTIQKIRDSWYWVVGEIEKDPRADFYRYDWKHRALPDYTGWEVFPDWEWYRSSADMVKRGIALLNNYLYNWMSRHYSLLDGITEEEVASLLAIVECLSGALGLRPTMLPHLSDANRAYIVRRLQDVVYREGEKYHHINPRTGEKDWQIKQLEELVTLEAIPPVLYPAALEAARNEASTAGISPYEFEHMIEWRLRNLSQDETDSLRALVYQTLAGSSLAESQPAYDRYCAILTVVGVGFLTDEAEAQRQWDNYGLIANMRAKVQATWLTQFVLGGCRYAGALLMKEPVFDTSHVYKEVEYNRRTYSDLREELVTKLVSLPKYQAIIHLASQENELPVQITTPSPVPISPDAESRAREIRERSRRELGHPWVEVAKDIQDRQNLPPEKPRL